MEFQENYPRALPFQRKGTISFTCSYSKSWPQIYLHFRSHLVSSLSNKENLERTGLKQMISDLKTKSSRVFLYSVTLQSELGSSNTPELIEHAHTTDGLRLHPLAFGEKCRFEEKKEWLVCQWGSHDSGCKWVSYSSKGRTSSSNLSFLVVGISHNRLSVTTRTQLNNV